LPPLLDRRARRERYRLASGAKYNSPLTSGVEASSKVHRQFRAAHEGFVS
jgi:hypothetical protein